ncbi:MAG: glycoside hydrolase family 97 protein [Bacteroidales bacterium]|nr:glycoside hydrolase family 97 protein [Bacteroidales bacterium]
MNFKKVFIALSIAALFNSGLHYSIAAQRPQTVQSPDGLIKVEINVSGDLSYNVYAGDKAVMAGNTLSMTIRDKVYGHDAKLVKATRKTVKETFSPFLKLKFNKVENNYNQLLMKFKGGYSVEFRAFNDGIAYRFITNLPGKVEVLDEEIGVRFPEACTLTLQQCDRFKTSYEEKYTHPLSTEWKEGDKMAHLPILAEMGEGCNIMFSETDLEDYPGAFFRSNGDNGFTSVFPKYPLKQVQDPKRDRSLNIEQEAEYIALTDGKREFPWRYFVITKEDGDLLTTTLPVRLAKRSLLEDESWIKPGQSSWEWWNGGIPYGPDVNFKSGLNLETYKYFIDFASHYGLEYIVMDEGWAKNTRDPFTPNPDIDLHELIRYGKEKNVGIILWLTWVCVENNPTLFEAFEKWGVAGIKIDFMDRSDQWMVNFYERTVAEAAKHHLIVNYHGAFKPSGLEYKYPNLLSYEGVRGLEQMGNCKPENSLYLPFLRNVTGAMEFTPGAMVCMQPEYYVSKRPNSAAVGTKTAQMAMFVVFESGLHMLADNPSRYYANDDCTKFISSVPQLWDETIALAAKVGQYVVVAKRKDNKWFIGGMTAERNEPIEIEIPLDFLGEGSYTMTSYEDGINAEVQGMDYRKNTKTVAKGDKITVKMVRNGGFAAVIE